MPGRTFGSFDDRVAALLERPELWRQFPGGVELDARDYMNRLGVRQPWIAVVDLLQARGLVSSRTLPVDVNVPKLVARCRKQSQEESNRA